MLKKAFARLRLFNPLLFACMMALIAVGVLFIYSSCSVRESARIQVQYLDHAVAGVLGLFAYAALACVDYRRVLKWGWLAYAGTLGLLVLVLLIGEETMGARRWLFGIQPSEVAKLGIIMVLAWLYGRRGVWRGARAFFLTGALVGVPAGLILMQPDLGTAMVLAPTALCMMFAANVAPRLLWTTLLTGVTAAGLLLGVIYAAERAEMPPERRGAPHQG
ncbi:MAG: FtsW/RodA/SpoVE family cell cycle protein, partial [Kiritimatiellaeota bacterium]|nr:FtsW/RodA/SpoVE family cell cycle protein [Kiritimatiellota bacterium]